MNHNSMATNERYAVGITRMWSECQLVCASFAAVFRIIPTTQLLISQV